MADVAQKAISANPIYNNRVVVVTNPQCGKIQAKENGGNHTISTTDMETKWTDRFDDRLFYSA